ncbi:LysR family transcriptional regulator [Desulfovibrio sp. OttesenSCG-928-C06]|nr:LysR family transcriptional regulator [Desulfovibrio sp. OttesenSCG-928-C06]
MELRYYRYFLAVAEELHFGRAAARLNIAQPALSIQIRELEKALGGALLERTSRSVRLTEAGKVFLREARLVLEQEERAFEKTSRMLRGEGGVLSLAYTGSAVFSGLLGKLLAKYRAACPMVEIRLQEMDPKRQLIELEKGSIHAGFMISSFLSPVRGVRMLPLASWATLLALPARHRLAGKKRLSVAMLADEPFVAYAGEDYESRIMRGFSAGFRPKIACEASNIMIMAAMVDAGLGLALVPEWLTTAKVSFDLVYKPVSEIRTTMDLHLAFRSSPGSSAGFSSAASPTGAPNIASLIESAAAGDTSVLPDTSPASQPDASGMASLPGVTDATLAAFLRAIA